MVGFRVERSLEIILVLMLLIGPFSSITAVIFAAKGHLAGWRRIVCYLVNGVWAALGVVNIIGYYLFRHGMMGR